ncbi:class III signal peptide-containing protein [Thermococcus sp. JdF3]|uniref:class III signal peptide-containing protein n=1 Tax=Thermococcus sp. JdF3 TaxID=1638258 RepID=UPI00143B56F1|nr:class III signal peptide-containing protein [Thermococcus sp. JdF3]
MFRLRRKKGQGAIEYLFMIAAALVIILIAVRYVSNAGQNASSQGDLAQIQAQVETIKAQLQASGQDLDEIKIPYTYNEISGETTFNDLYKICTGTSTSGTLEYFNETANTTQSTSLSINRYTACKAIVDWWNKQ